MNRSSVSHRLSRRHRTFQWGVVAALASGAGMSVSAGPKGKDYSDQDVQKRDFSGKNLEDSTFENADGQGANFKTARLARASFRGADLRNADFWDADCSGCDFRKAKLHGIAVLRTNFTGANLEEQDLSQVYLSSPILRGANLRNLKAIGSSVEVDFRDADLRGANFLDFKNGGGSASRFRGATYDKATRWPKGFDPEEAEAVLVGPDGKRADGAQAPAAPKAPEGLDFARQNLANKEYVGTDLSRASFFEADLPNAKFKKVTAPFASFEGADLTKAIFEGCDLSGADLRRILAEWPEFKDTKLNGANLQNVNLRRVSLVRVSLVGADLRSVRGINTLDECDLSQADLRGADLSQFADASGSVSRPSVKWTGARYDRHTRWPSSFDPKAAGAVLAE